jgi:serine/threonine protein kinase
MDGCLRRCLGQHENTRGAAAGGARKLICGHFELGECIGQGGFADVWSAQDVRKRGKVTLALKRLKTPWSDEASARRAYREISVQQFLHHDNLLPLLACYRDDEPLDPSQQTVWIVLPRHELDLHVAIRTRRVATDAQRRSIAFQLLCAVAHLHARRLVHRDIKPVNILLSAIPASCTKSQAAATRQGSKEVPAPETRFDVTLCDFGLVRPEGGPSKSLAFPPPPEIYQGSRWYIAPEVLLGSGEVSCSADMWSVGCVLSELHTGTTLFVGASTADQLRRTVALTGLPTEEDLDQIRTSAPIAAAALARMTLPAEDASPLLPALPGDRLNGLLRALLRLIPKNRMSAETALAHPHLATALSEEEARAAADACAPPMEEEMARLIPQLGDHEVASAYRRFVNSRLVANPMSPDEDKRETHEQGEAREVQAEPAPHAQPALAEGLPGAAAENQSSAWRSRQWESRRASQEHP